MTTVASSYHIEINPGDAGIYDRFVVQEVIKEIAQYQSLEKSFKGECFMFLVCGDVCLDIMAFYDVAAGTTALGSPHSCAA